MKIKLRLDVTTNDAKNIIMWLENKDVTKFLNEDKNSATSLQYIIESGQINLLRYYLNRDGRFFLIDSENEKCLGFITLFTIISKKEYEVIIAIGNPENWGKQIALYALKSLLLEVFFKWRIEKVIAKIHIENLRSIKLFEHLGFKNSKISNSHIIFSIPFDEYFNMLKNN